MLLAATSTSELVVILAGGIWIPVLIIGVLYVYRERYRSYRGFEREARSKDASEAQLARLLDLTHGLESFLPRIMEELPARVAREVSRSGRGEREGLAEVIRSALAESSPSGQLADESQISGLIGEISHALNTPLSQAEAAAVSAHRSLSEQDVDAGLLEDLAQVAVSVAMCGYFLSAFRLLALGATVSSDESPGRLEDILNEAAKVYMRRRSDRLVDITANLGQGIAGYDDSYVLAIVLPLLENAIEAAPAGTRVDIGRTDSNGTAELTVSNATNGALPDNDWYRPGVTSKPNHDGLGLPMVNRLLGAAGGTLAHHAQDDRITFTASLPVREGT